jgi:hypothetical protein
MRSVAMLFWNRYTSEVFDLKPTSTWSLSAVRRYHQYTDTVDRYPRPISISPLAYSLRNTGDPPALSDSVQMTGSIP